MDGYVWNEIIRLNKSEWNGTLYDEMDGYAWNEMTRLNKSEWNGIRMR